MCVDGKVKLAQMPGPLYISIIFCLFPFPVYSAIDRVTHSIICLCSSNNVKWILCIATIHLRLAWFLRIYLERSRINSNKTNDSWNAILNMITTLSSRSGHVSVWTQPGINPKLYVGWLPIQFVLTCLCKRGCWMMTSYIQGTGSAVSLKSPYIN